jgi:hypothetical protein
MYVRERIGAENDHPYAKLIDRALRGEGYGRFKGDRGSIRMESDVRADKDMERPRCRRTDDLHQRRLRVGV